MFGLFGALPQTPSALRRSAAAILADQQALRGIYGALPQTPSAFLEKAEEKQYFTAKYLTHSVRVVLCGLFLFNNQNGKTKPITKTQNFNKFCLCYPHVAMAKKQTVFFAFDEKAKVEREFYGVPGSREGAHTLRVLFWHLFSYERKKCGGEAPLQYSRTSKRK